MFDPNNVLNVLLHTLAKVKIKRLSRQTLPKLVLCFCLCSFLLITHWACQSNQKKESSAALDGTEEMAITQIHNDYVEGWKIMDKERIMSLFEDGARIQPNKLMPIEGKENLRAFWFPEDGSITTINDFTTKIIHLAVLDTLAITTHLSMLDWSYTQDTFSLGMIQHGVNTTVYRKQPDTGWKIWRSMWTDFTSFPR